MAFTCIKFTIHAPRAGRDDAHAMWSAVRDVSIHAPRAGRDRCAALVWYAVSGFNPRAPRGARLSRLSYNTTIQAFQSTRPARGATPPLSVLAGGPSGLL